MDIRCGRCGQRIYAHTCTGIEENKCGISVSENKYKKIESKARRSTLDIWKEPPVIIPAYDPNNRQKKNRCRAVVDGISCNRFGYFKGRLCKRHFKDINAPIILKEAVQGRKEQQ